MLAILEPICAGLLVSLFNKFMMPIIVQCVEPERDDDNSSETSAINAEVHVHAD